MDYGGLSRARAIILLSFGFVFVMKILLIDNYDSFTFIIRHYLLMSGDTLVHVIRNDEPYHELAEECDALVLSPGPGLPSESGFLMDIIRQYHAIKPILGICLGHQAIAQFFGARLFQLSEVCHGIPDVISADESDILYRNIHPTLEVARYHSWMVDHQDLPDCLIPTGFDKGGGIMSLRHISLPIFGVQYHPESIMTPNGLQIIKNWVGYVSGN